MAPIDSATKSKESEEGPSVLCTMKGTVNLFIQALHNLQSSPQKARDYVSQISDRIGKPEVTPEHFTPLVGKILRYLLMKNKGIPRTLALRHGCVFQDVSILANVHPFIEFLTYVSAVAFELGMYTCAKTILFLALDSIDNVPTDGSPSFIVLKAILKNNIGCVLMMNGDCQVARNWFVEAKQDLQEVEDSPTREMRHIICAKDTMETTITINYAHLEMIMGEFQKALSTFESLFKKSVSVLEKEIEPRMRKQHFYRKDLFYHDTKGDPSDFKTCAKSTFSAEVLNMFPNSDAIMMQKELENKLFLALAVFTNLANANYAMCKWCPCEDAIRQCLKGLDLLPVKLPNAEALWRLRLCLVLRSLGRYAEAQAINENFVMTLEKMEVLQDEFLAETFIVGATEETIRALCKEGEWAKGEKMLSLVFQACEAVLGSDHTTLLGLAFIAASLYPLSYKFQDVHLKFETIEDLLIRSPLEHPMLLEFYEMSSRKHGREGFVDKSMLHQEQAEFLREKFGRQKNAGCRGCGMFGVWVDNNHVLEMSREDLIAFYGTPKHPDVILKDVIECKSRLMNKKCAEAARTMLILDQVESTKTALSTVQCCSLENDPNVLAITVILLAMALYCQSKDAIFALFTMFEDLLSSGGARVKYINTSGLSPAYVTKRESCINDKNVTVFIIIQYDTSNSKTDETFRVFYEFIVDDSNTHKYLITCRTSDIPDVNKANKVVEYVMSFIKLLYSLPKNSQDPGLYVLDIVQTLPIAALSIVMCYALMGNPGQHLLSKNGVAFDPRTSVTTCDFADEWEASSIYRILVLRLKRQRHVQGNLQDDHSVFLSASHTKGIVQVFHMGSSITIATGCLKNRNDDEPECDEIDALEHVVRECMSDFGHVPVARVENAFQVHIAIVSELGVCRTEGFYEGLEKECAKLRDEKESLKALLRDEKRESAAKQSDIKIEEAVLLLHRATVADNEILGNQEQELRVSACRDSDEHTILEDGYTQTNSLSMEYDSERHPYQAPADEMVNPNTDGGSRENPLEEDEEVLCKYGMKYFELEKTRRDLQMFLIPAEVERMRQQRREHSQEQTDPASSTQLLHPSASQNAESRTRSTSEDPPWPSLPQTATNQTDATDLVDGVQSASTLSLNASAPGKDIKKATSLNSDYQHQAINLRSGHVIGDAVIRPPFSHLCEDVVADSDIVLDYKKTQISDNDKDESNDKDKTKTPLKLSRKKMDVENIDLAKTGEQPKRVGRQIEVSEISTDEKIENIKADKQGDEIDKDSRKVYEKDTQECNGSNSRTGKSEALALHYFIDDSITDDMLGYSGSLGKTRDHSSESSSMTREQTYDKNARNGFSSDVNSASSITSRTIDPYPTVPKPAKDSAVVSSVYKRTGARPKSRPLPWYPGMSQKREILAPPVPMYHHTQTYSGLNNPAEYSKSQGLKADEVTGSFGPVVRSMSGTFNAGYNSSLLMPGREGWSHGNERSLEALEETMSSVWNTLESFAKERESLMILEEEHRKREREREEERRKDVRERMKRRVEEIRAQRQHEAEQKERDQQIEKESKVREQQQLQEEGRQRKQQHEQEQQRQQHELQQQQAEQRQRERFQQQGQPRQSQQNDQQQQQQQGVIQGQQRGRQRQHQGHQGQRQQSTQQQHKQQPRQSLQKKVKTFVPSYEKCPSQVTSDEWPCEHYKRRCHVMFPCCLKFFPCHRCHNESKECRESSRKAKDAIRLICLTCLHEQDITEKSNSCQSCKAPLAEFFCGICKHFTGNEKKPYHCDKCGICRIHKDQSFHCEVCNVCLDVRLQGKHKCRENSGHDECCICLEDAFTGCQVLACSHKVHRDCAVAMVRNGVRNCPICRHPLYTTTSTTSTGNNSERNDSGHNEDINSDGAEQ
ncbi:uncharacterized protein LOC5508988 [Nematostella vectensis]|uniref:uncharacterized protein LOC5508988 n=1 Tax=Nematostella vectensis TaxID=45351 RepID=UPI0020775FE3|nr:uncharacterized protein LOC5508988 [Nematostella vectensis]